MTTGAPEPSPAARVAGDRDLQRALMDLALAEARQAAASQEVPIGAIAWLDGEVIGRGQNRTLRDADPTAHAEIVALREAARTIANHRLTGCVVVSTLEPCLMCCGALVHARAGLLVYAAPDPKAGAVHLLATEGEEGRLNHRVEVLRGPRGSESAGLLRTFFQARR